MKIIIYTKEKIYNFKTFNDKNYNYAVDHAHREDGPAYIKYYDNGNISYKAWYLNGLKHRINKPAVINYFEKNNNIINETWYINGKLHREDGPAIISYYENKNIFYEKYYLNGKEYSIIEFNRKIFKRKLQLF